MKLPLCGVCTPEFGHNLVVPPPPIPEFVGEFKPNQEKVQKIRVWFGKYGDMALVSHLDLVRLFDRVVRRAGIPITYTGGFHPGPKIAIALALSLGMTSNSEIVDFELHSLMDVEEFKRKLVAQLPSQLPVWRVEEIPVKSPKATQLLDKAEYLITISTEEDISLTQWQIWLNAVKNAPEIMMEKRDKKGKKKTVNLRENLYDIVLLNDNFTETKTVDILYLGSAINDGSLLTPDHVCYMLEQISGQELTMIKAHRERIYLASNSHFGKKGGLVLY